MAADVKAYRENNKYYTLLKNNQLDDYIDASDFDLDGNYQPSDDFGGNDPELLYNTFGYEEDDMPVSSEITDEMINGAVPESYLPKFTRKDVTVKIGAIIRSNDGAFYTSGSVGRTYSFLTVNEAFEILGITADYSIVSVYGNSDYSENELIEQFSEYAAIAGGNMVFENWLSDTKTYKIFNFMVDIFVISLIVILLLTALVVMVTQFLNMTQFSTYHWDRRCARHRICVKSLFSAGQFNIYRACCFNNFSCVRYSEFDHRLKNEE